MKKIICLVLNFTVLFCTAQNNFNIVPAPASIQSIDTSYTYDLPIQIVHTKSEAAVFNAVYLLEALKERNITGYLVAYDSFDMNRSKIMLIDEDEPTEKYRIITPGKDIVVSGNNRTIFYGIQTLLQLIPSNQYYNTKNKFSIPYVSITDHPRFLYRGMHLDVCRHFFPVSFVKKYIDYLAAYKFNTFHWHLTDDQGWRIEIKKYPGLTTAGAWRNGTIIGRYPGKGSDNKPYGGFYTQEEIKEVVQYAAQRYIDVVPEIEMPGHGSAAIAAYPWLSCFPKKPTEIPAKMISQKSIDEQKNGRIKLVQETWGVFDDIFCAGRDSTFTFLENVIDEVIALFPSKYFHMGGDEAPKAHWKKCPSCQKRMKDHKLKDEHELQSWFVQRIEKYVNSKGRILIGWDEILEGGLAPNAVVMSWRGEKGGIEAAKQKHPVIMTPGNPVYFDHTQSKNEDSVTIGGYNPIENVYAYEPIPKELSTEEAKYILGAQANMWTEYIKYPSKVEYHLFPRITALSEVLWSPKGKRNWKDFERRLPTIFERLDKQKINYSKAYYDLKATVMPTPDYNGILYKIETNTKNYKIQYIPSMLSSSFLTYEKPLLIRENVNDMSVILSVDGKVVGGITQSFHFNKATGKKITIVTEADKKYPGDGAFTLVNGVQNEKGMSKTSEFLGFNGTDMEVTIDLGKETEVSKITLHSLNHPGSWIYLPGQVDISFIPYIDTTIITKHPPIE
ncbi:MAG: beta-N-acetylhexosaminidase [Ferruginibacter sp.]